MNANTATTAAIRKLLPALILGVVITLLAALMNYLIYERRLSARAIDNRIVSADANKNGQAPRRLNPVISALRGFAGIVNVADDFAQELMFSVRGPGDFPSTGDEIAVIAIDEDSLVRHGAWPWSSADIAKLLEAAGDARVVALDLLFPEPDRASPANHIEQLSDLLGDRRELESLLRDRDLSLDNDRLLAGRIAVTPTVLSNVLFSGTPPLNKPASMRNNRPVDIRLPDGTAVTPEKVMLKGGRYALTDIPVIRDSIPPPVGEGFMNVFPGPNGVVRSIPLIAHVSDHAFAVPSGSPLHIVPSVVLEIIRVMKGGDGYRVNLRGDTVYIPGFQNEEAGGNRYAVNSVSILGGEKELFDIPLNEQAEMELAFRAHADDFATYPAWEVLEGLHAGAFTNKAVVIGSMVESVGHVVSPGMQDSELSIPRAHAAMISAMLKGDIIDGGYLYDFFWQQTAIFAMGLAVTVAIVFTDVLAGMLLSALILVGWILCNYFFFFKRNVDVGVILPVVTTLAVMGVLTVANYFVVGRERRFIRKAFQLNVSPSILGFLETHPDRLSSLQGDYRHMTVLFTDIRGFTGISEKFSAPALARFLNEYFTPMSDIVMARMGTVDKFIGDGMMAFWNAPADNPRHARDAADSTLDMLEKLKELQPGWSKRGLPLISIGCSINTGPMFAGYMGSEQRKNYTVMGDSVNIASRLEGLNKVYSTNILITESTREELGRDFVCRVADKVRLSGKAAAVVIHELLGRGPASEDTAEELAAFKRVFELYQEREFAAAQSLLKELVFIRPSPLYSIYLDRLAIYKALPPPPDWDGTFVMTGK